LDTYLEEELGNRKYHSQESGILNTGFMLVLLDHGSRTNGRDQSILYNISGHYTTLKLSIYLEVALGNTKYHHHHSGIPDTGFMLVLLDSGSRKNHKRIHLFLINFPESFPINCTSLKLANLMSFI
jgi:hypothetical protein